MKHTYLFFSLVTLFSLTTHNMEHDCNEGDNNSLRFLNACANGNHKILKLLLQKHPELVSACDAQGRSGLVLIAINARGKYMECAQTYLANCTGGEQHMSHQVTEKGTTQHYNAATYAQKFDREDSVNLFKQYGLEDIYMK